MFIIPFQLSVENIIDKITTVYFSWIYQTKNSCVIVNLDKGIELIMFWQTAHTHMLLSLSQMTRSTVSGKSKTIDTHVLCNQWSYQFALWLYSRYDLVDVHREGDFSGHMVVYYYFKLIELLKTWKTKTNTACVDRQRVFMFHLDMLR